MRAGTRLEYTGGLLAAASSPYSLQGSDVFLAAASSHILAPTGIDLRSSMLVPVCRYHGIPVPPIVSRFLSPSPPVLRKPVSFEY